MTDKRTGMARIGLLPLALAAACGCTAQPRGEFRELRSEATSFKGLVYTPHRTGSPATPPPMILFLHGAGERGDDPEMLKRQGLPRELATGRFPDFPFVVVAPQCPKDHWWSPHDLVQLVDETVEGLLVDPDRVYVTGMSMGGYGTWSIITAAPDRFAAAVPICGGGNPDRAERTAGVAVWAFHGSMDPVIPLHESLVMVQRVLDAGGEAKFTVYSLTGHDAWTRTYRNPAVYDWLLSHRRGARPASSDAAFSSTKSVSVAWGEGRMPRQRQPDLSPLNQGFVLPAGDMP